ncbi:MAG: hypothetical protein NT099_07900 [Candidatus Saganbacteria bacterium]|nr:hypothetical protein [Candidatus Saganbacteria bacterium]
MKTAEPNTYVRIVPNGRERPPAVLPRVSKPPQAVLVVVHDNNEYDECQVVTKQIAGLMRLRGVLFTEVYEYQTTEHVSHFPRCPGETEENFPREVIRQDGADYTIPDLSGRVFVLTGGGFAVDNLGYCHYAAFKNLTEHFLQTGRKGPLEVHMPADAIFFNREDGAEGETWLDAISVNILYMQRNIEPYTRDLQKKDISYAVVAYEAGELKVVAGDPENAEASIFLWPDWQTLRDHLASRLQ